MTRPRTWIPWAGFLCVVTACLALSVGAGDWIVRVTQPQELGESGLGEWAEFTEHGFSVRLDAVELAPSLPSAYDPSNDVPAPEGFVFLRVLMTVEPLVGPEDYFGCLMRVRDGDGAEIDNQEYGVEGPASSHCTRMTGEDDDSGPLGVGDQFQSQSVFIVLPDELDTFTVEVVPIFGKQKVFWTFRLG